MNKSSVFDNSSLTCELNWNRLLGIHFFVYFANEIKSFSYCLWEEEEEEKSGILILFYYYFSKDFRTILWIALCVLILLFYGNYFHYNSIPAELTFLSGEDAKFWFHKNPEERFECLVGGYLFRMLWTIYLKGRSWSNLIVFK